MSNNTTGKKLTDTLPAAYRYCKKTYAITAEAPELSKGYMQMLRQYRSINDRIDDFLREAAPLLGWSEYAINKDLKWGLTYDAFEVFCREKNTRILAASPHSKQLEEKVEQILQQAKQFCDKWGEE